MYLLQHALTHARAHAHRHICISNYMHTCKLGHREIGTNVCAQIGRYCTNLRDITSEKRCVSLACTFTHLSTNKHPLISRALCNSLTQKIQPSSSSTNILSGKTRQKMTRQMTWHETLPVTIRKTNKQTKHTHTHRHTTKACEMAVHKTLQIKVSRNEWPIYSCVF